jgi:putative Mg2+ transporter-C (MgtC) family protein
MTTYISDYVNQAPELIGLLIKLALSMLSGTLIGFERGRHGRSAGLRTHILVCLGATMASMVDLHVFSLIGSDGTRIAANVLTGVGFLGAGVILIKRDFTVKGLTTAAGLWATSIIGLCYGYGFCEIPLITTVVLLLIFALMPYMESTQKAEVSIYLEIDQLTAVNTVMGALHDTCPLMLHIEVTAPLSGDSTHVGIRLRTIGKNARKIKDPFALLTEIRKIEHVIYAVMD